MDIDQIAKQVQELLAWKAKVGPLLELQMADYEKWQANQKAGQTEEETEEQERERICREADEIRAKEAEEAGGQSQTTDPDVTVGNVGTTDPKVEVGQSWTTGGANHPDGKPAG